MAGSIKFFKDDEPPPTPAPSPTPYMQSRFHHTRDRSPLAISTNDDITMLDRDSLDIDIRGRNLNVLDMASALYDGLPNAQKLQFITRLLLASDREVLSETLNFVDPRLRKDPFSILPNEVSLKILSYIDDPQTLARCAEVSKMWYFMVSDDYSWKELCQKHHFRRLSATVNIDHQRPSVSHRPSVALDPAQVDPHHDVIEALYNPNYTRRPSPKSYKSHFKLQYLLNSAWAAGGRTAARYTINHQGVVTALAANDRYIVISLDNSKIFVFRSDGKMLRSLFGHVMGVWALALYGHILISGGCDRDVRAWDLRSGDCLQIMKGHTGTVRCLQMADSKTGISGSRDSTVRIWDLEKGVCSHVLEGHELSVRCIEVHGDIVVSGSYDCTAKIWNLRTGELVHTLIGHFSQIYSLAFDGQRIATGSMDTSIRIWNPVTGVCVCVLQGHTSLVGQLQMRDNTLVSGGSDGAIRIWDLVENRCVARIAAHDNSVSSLQFDGERIISGGSDGRVRVWRLSDGQYIRDLSMQFEMVWKVAMEDDEIIIVASRAGRAIMEVTSFIPPIEEGSAPETKTTLSFSKSLTAQRLSTPDINSPKSEPDAISPLAANDMDIS